MIKLFLSFALFFTTQSFASICKIESYNYLYRFNSFDRNVIKSTDCSEEKSQQFLSYINLDSTKIVKPETLYADFGIFITNHEISVQNLTDIISLKNSSIHFKIINIIASSKFLFSDTPVFFKSNNLRTDLGRYNLEMHTSLGNIFINYTVQKETQALVAKHDLNAHGASLTEHDFEIKTIMIDNLNFLPLNTFSQAINMRLNRNLKAGDILSNNMLYSPELIKFGDIIKTQVETGGIYIEFNARALKPGKLNEIIQLENLNSKKSFGAQVTGPGKIKVLL